MKKINAGRSWPYWVWQCNDYAQHNFFCRKPTKTNKISLSWGSSMNQIWQKNNFKIYHVDDGYILHNYKMDGFCHSHLKNYNTAVFLADLSIHKRIPHHLNRYLIISLLRVNDDEEYCRKIRDLLSNKKPKDMYFNSQKGVRKRK